MDIEVLRKRLNKMAIVCLIIAVVVFIINYFVFHYVTDAGITLEWQPEAGKPFFADLIGILGANMVFASIISALSAKILCKKN
jgi:hypothetical protein